MSPTGKNCSVRRVAFANRCTQRAKTSYFLPLQCNKKAIKHVDAESGRASKTSSPTVEMCLRIRPIPMTLRKSYVILNSRTLLTLSPFEDKFIRNSRGAKSSEAEGRRHAFTKIFGSETSQAEMFEGSIKHRVAEFLGGKSSTIMTYGMRDSGKTYTLFGTSASPGIITRCIDHAFSAINCTIAPWYKPTFQGNVICLNETARASEMQRKTRVLNRRSTDVRQTFAEARKFLVNSRPGNADPDKCEECCGESMYAVWLSFAEIYNGNVYDLLDDAETRSPLRLYVNTEGRAYVCGLQKVHAITALEAYRILVTGQSRMSTVATGSRRTRSHTIFTVELLRYQKDHAAEEVTLSTLTFCDLVGSTHFEKSHMREASNINNSLLVLGRCLKAASQNQMAPFRQSKLTRICQRALSGEENLSIIVNVVFRPSFSDETQGIFNFCDIVRKLLTNHSKEYKQCDLETTVRDSDTCDSNDTASPSSHQSFEMAEMAGCTDSTACRNVREQNRRLREELETVKSDMLNCEYVIRRQLADHYSHMIGELEATYEENTKKIETEGHDLLKWSVKQVESFYKERIDNLTRHKKRKREDNGDHVEDHRLLYEELEAENAQITSKMTILKEVVKKLTRENKTILCEKNKCSFELALITKELKKFRQLALAGISKWGGDGENIEDDADCLMNNLERLMDKKIKRAEKKLEEMNEYVRTMENKGAETKGASEAKQKLSKSEDVLNDALIKIQELEQELLLKDDCIIRLQHCAQLQERQLAEVQQRLDNTKNENITDGMCKCDRSTNISSNDYSAESFFQENMSTGKSSSRMCMNSSTVKQHEFEDWIIVPTMFEDHVESTKQLLNASNVDRKNLFENYNMNGSVSRSSDRSSKDDSGVSSELQNESQRSTSINDNSSILGNEDKCTQICVEDCQIAVEGNVEQIDCADSNKWSYQETLHVVELSQDLETIRDVIYALNEETCANECQLLHKEGTLGRSTEEASKITMKRDDLFKVIENKMQGYKHEICELIRKLTIKKENENRIFKCLERYVESSRGFENKLSSMRNRLDKAFSKCANEHLPKIACLEEEVLQKALQINELDEKISKIQRDFAKGYELFQKIHDFEIIVNKCWRDKKELCRQLYECSENQLTLEDKLKKLTMKIEGRESEVISLKSEIHNIGDLNVVNNEKARNLYEQIVEAGESIDSIKEDLRCCEDLSKNVENIMKAEVHDFRSRLSDHKNNTTFLNEICKTYGDSQDEITLLKRQLEHKELEATLLKTNRDTTIKKYEILIRHFQKEIEEKNKHFKTVANSSNNLKEPSTENQRQSEEILKNHETENNLASSSCFIPKHTTSEILNVSSDPSEDSTTFSDEIDDIKFDDNESCQADSSVKSNIGLPVYETDRSETEGIFNIISPGTKDKKKILDWMKVRRISGKIALSQLSAKHTDINNDSETK